MSLMSCAHCTVRSWPSLGCTIPAVFSPSYPRFPVLAVISRLSPLIVLSILLCHGYPVPDVLSRLSCPGCLVPTVMSWLSCLKCLVPQLSFHHCHFFAVKSWPSGPSIRSSKTDLSRPTCQADLSRWTCPGCPVLDVLFWISCNGCPATLSHPGCSVLAVMWSSFPIFHVLAVLFWFLPHLFSSSALVISSPAPAVMSCSDLSRLNVKRTCPGWPVLTQLSCPRWLVLTILS